MAKWKNKNQKSNIREYDGKNLNRKIENKSLD